VQQVQRQPTSGDRGETTLESFSRTAIWGMSLLLQDGTVSANCSQIRKSSLCLHDIAMSDDQVTTNVLFAEYANKNGAGTRVSWAKKLISAESISSILGAAYTSWVDSGYLNLSAL
jgi:hypothetical protein